MVAKNLYKVSCPLLVIKNLVKYFVGKAKIERLDSALSPIWSIVYSIIYVFGGYFLEEKGILTT